MKIVISESQYNLIKKDLDEDYPESWNIETFKNLNTFKDRINYCNQHLKRISSGSSRIVYKVDDLKVLKLAKNRKGIAQNEVEVSYGNDYYLEGLLAEIYEHDENNLWVEMQLARRVTPKIFKDIVGYDFLDYSDSLHHLNYIHFVKPGVKNAPKPVLYDVMWENDFINRMFDYVVNYEVPVGDLTRLSTYGLVNDGKQDSIVLIDYGLTNEVYTSYYD
jgi:hypothetical protein